MLIISVNVYAPAEYAEDIKEQIAMDLESIGRVEIVRVKIVEYMKLNIIALVDRPLGPATPAELKTINALERYQDTRVVAKKQIEPEQLTIAGT